MSIPPDAPGGVGVVRDTQTGLDWLPFDYTAGLSLYGILFGQGGWLAAGWRYATQDEVCEMIEHAVDAAPGTGCGIAMSTENAGTMLGLFGTLDVQMAGSRTLYISEAFYNDGHPGIMQGGAVFAVEEPFFLIGPVVAVAPDSLSISSRTGNYSAPVASLLVRESPQPVPVLGGVGSLVLVAGLVTVVRHRRASTASLGG